MSRRAVSAGLKPGRRINMSWGGGNQGPDVEGFKAADDLASDGNNALGRNIAAALKVQRQRETDTLTGANPTRFIGGPLPDMAWDGFFGAMQQKEERANEHGLRFKANLAGNGPGEGIGQLASRNVQGMTTHPLRGLGRSPSIDGLKSAAQQINKNAADVFAAKRRQY